MSTSITHLLPYPIKGARYTIKTAMSDGNFDFATATTPVVNISKDFAAAATGTESLSFLAGVLAGIGIWTATGDETNCVSLDVKFSDTDDIAKPTVHTLTPLELPIFTSGIMTAGAASTATIATGLPDLKGCILKTTGGTGGGGGSGSRDNQARFITAYNSTTGVATIAGTWETNPDATTTYAVLVTEYSHAVLTTLTALTDDAIEDLANGLLDLPDGVEANGDLIDGLTIRKALRGLFATAVARMTGASTATLRFRNSADTKDRVVSFDNRDNVSFDLD
jgi:hypothetical protein